MPWCPKGETYVSTCGKYTLLFINLLFWVLGGGLLGAGIWAYTEKSKYEVVEVKTVSDFIFDISILFMIIGSIVFIIAFVGFIGALRENTFFLKFFFYSLIIIFLLEVALVVYVFVRREHAIDVISDAIKEAYIITYLDAGREDNNAIANYFQENFQCCGARTYEDWNQNEYFNCTKENKSGWRCSVPYSCCKKQDDVNDGQIINLRCGGNALNKSRNAVDGIYKEGCVDVMLLLAEQNLPIVIGVVLAFFIPQFIGIWLGRQLTGQIEDQRERYRNRIHR